MDVFISWSGERSRAAAEALRGWLAKIINAVKPWLSSEDIDKGARWGTDVATRLEAAKAGIICLTPSNLHSDWILFEAGTLSKTLQNTYVCPFLIDMDPSDVKPPLSQFQATRAQRADALKLLRTLNGALSEPLPETHIEDAFEVWWPRLESQLKTLPAEDSKAKTHRPDRELLEELLALVRSQTRPTESPQVPAAVTAPATHKIGKKFPYDLSTGVMTEAVIPVVTRHGMTLDKITRLVPDKAYSRIYRIVLSSGLSFTIEVAEMSSDEAMAKQVSLQLDEMLQKTTLANKESSPSQIVS